VTGKKYRYNPNPMLEQIPAIKRIIESISRRALAPGPQFNSDCARLDSRWALPGRLGMDGCRSSFGDDRSDFRGALASESCLVSTAGAAILRVFRTRLFRSSAEAVEPLGQAQWREGIAGTYTFSNFLASSYPADLWPNSLAVTRAKATS
jgi:hypothetical protein